MRLWFAEKFVSLLIEQHPANPQHITRMVVICWKIRIFAYWTTPEYAQVSRALRCDLLKNSYLCLLNNTSMPMPLVMPRVVICWKIRIFAYWTTPLLFSVISIVSLWFAEKFVSLLIEQHQAITKMKAWFRCDLLKNSYLCLLNNTAERGQRWLHGVVICWKIRIFAYWTTPSILIENKVDVLWFAEKFVSLLIEQHPQHNME